MYNDESEFFDDVCLLLQKGDDDKTTLNAIIDNVNAILAYRQKLSDQDAEYKARRSAEYEKLKSENRCTYDIYYAGRCGRAGFPYCEMHSKEKCHCGKQAIHDCGSCTSMFGGEGLCGECDCSK